MPGLLITKNSLDTFTQSIQTNVYVNPTARSRKIKINSPYT